MLALGVTLAFAATAALLGSLAWRGSQRRLRPRGLLGIPLPALRRDDATWFAGHEAAAGPVGVAAGIAAAGAVAVAAAGTDLVGTVAAVVAAVGTVAGACVGVLAAARATR